VPHNTPNRAHHLLISDQNINQFIAEQREAFEIAPVLLSQEERLRVFLQVESPDVLYFLSRVPKYRKISEVDLTTSVKQAIASYSLDYDIKSFNI